MTKTQWESLPPAQQADLQSKQYAIDAQRRQQAEAARLEREGIAAEQARFEQERVRQSYATARYGDVIQVTVQGGVLQYGKDRYSYDPVSFDLVKGETKVVEFRGQGQRTLKTRYQAHLSGDGNTLTFDDSSRQRFVLVNADWQHSQTYQPGSTENDVGVTLAGATFTVRFKDREGAPQRVIIENS